jgi:hypothetical protein
MSEFIINKTKNTPQVFIDCNNGEIKFEGSCMPEDSIEFFSPIYEKTDCFTEVKKEVKFTLNIDYINSGSLKAFVDLFLKVKEMNLNQIVIVWFVEEDDEELIDTIEDIHRISDLNFEIKYI